VVKRLPISSEVSAVSYFAFPKNVWAVANNESANLCFCRRKLAIIKLTFAAFFAQTETVGREF
jgi:hypothetical protein